MKRGQGRLTVVGLGPGDPRLLAPEVLDSLAAAQTVVGYSGYVDLVDDSVLEGKRVVATGMRGEVERCEAAVDAALAGERVCLVCSGDPGVYAMAGLVLEIMAARHIGQRDVDLSILPGIPAVCAAAALLGAPLTHDFACVSLSDLLTPWDVIHNRLEHALAGDFVLALYNPRSRKRRDHLAQALEITARHRAPDTPVGHVRNAFRPDQSVSLARLGAFDPADADMFSIILVGNSSTRILSAADGSAGDWNAGARMFTPRGYGGKYALG